MRRAARRDDNESLIVEAIREAGWSVHQIDDKGFPDLVVAKDRHLLLIEVIGAAKAAKYRKTGGLTPAQIDFHRAWKGIIHCVSTVGEALSILEWELS